METPESIEDFLADRRMGNIQGFQGCLLPYHNMPIVQEIPMSILPVQSYTIWGIHCSSGIHNGSQRSQTDGSKQGYKDVPVPRWLVGESHIPPNLSPAYTDSSSFVPRTRLNS